MGELIRVDLQKHNQPSGTLLNEKVAQLALAEDSISELINRRRQEIREQCGDDERAFDSQMKEFIRQQRESVANKCADLYEGHDDAFGYALLYSEFFDSTPLAQQKALIAKFGNWLKSTRTVQEISKKIELRKEPLKVCRTQILRVLMLMENPLLSLISLEKEITF